MSTPAPGRPVRLADIPANRRRGGDLRVLLGPRTCGATAGFGGVLHLGPGEYVSEHYHPYSEEFLFVVRGELEMTLDGEAVALGADDALMVPRGVRHRLVNTGATEAFVVFHTAPLAPRPELGHVDTEPLPPGAPDHGAVL
ncbi:cupin domain-containing protein [Actinokineospora enzanensis]|uniref:cupin domain-containing protein n=1 Tax=Actinokineospora enzanensis TaxID=155975 RepID=UPI0003A46BCD|nr:cupin domain-containing protein [Actinokineospora enzanensis]